jgi:TRAP-type mannitol/chloroaromatic compound transport system substrate-binding protein
MHESNSMLEIIVNTDVWKGFTPQQQDAWRSATFDTFVRWGIKWQKQNADAIEEMRTKHGTQMLRTPPAILVDFLKTWDKIAAEESAKSPFFKKVLDSQRDTRRRSCRRSASCSRRILSPRTTTSRKAARRPAKGK